MSFLASYSGLRRATPKRMILDAGAAWKNINIAELDATGITAALETPWVNDDGVTVTPERLGATREGAEFDPGKEEASIEVNGVRVPIKGFQRTNSYAPTLQLTFLEMADLDTLKLALAQSDTETTASGYDKTRPRLTIKNSDYTDNIAILASTTEDDQAKPAIIVVENVKVVENATIPFEDPGEVAVAATLAGHALITSPYEVPCILYLPVPEDGLGS